MLLLLHIPIPPEANNNNAAVAGAATGNNVLLSVEYCVV